MFWIIYNIFRCRLPRAAAALLVSISMSEHVAKHEQCIRLLCDRRAEKEMENSVDLALLFLSVLLVCVCVLFASPPTHIFFHIYMYIPTVYYDVDDDAFIRYYCIGQRPVSLFRRRHSLTTDNMCINKENEKLYGARVNNTREKV